MGTQWGGNGDEQPPGGGGPSDGMPGLPPEWGPVVIPDDASALDDEAAVVRREMRRDIRRYRWRRRLRLSAPGNRDTPSLGVPLAIMAIAVVATLISLFAVAWPGYDGSPSPDSVTTRARPLTLPDLTLKDSDGVPVRIRDTAPAVVILIDGCRCDRIIAELAAKVDSRVSVLAVTTPDPNASASPSGSGAPGAPGGSGGPGSSSPGGTGGPGGTGPGGTTAGGAGPATSPATGPWVGPVAPATPTYGPNLASTDPSPSGSSGPGRAPSATPSRTGPPSVRVRTLIDPAGALRASVPGPPTGPGTGAILLVSLDWAVIRVVPTSDPISELEEDLERLAG
jgi:hypothetical protein